MLSPHFSLRTTRHVGSGGMALGEGGENGRTVEVITQPDGHNCNRRLLVRLGQARLAVCRGPCPSTPWRVPRSATGRQPSQEASRDLGIPLGHSSLKPEGNKHRIPAVGQRDVGSQRAARLTRQPLKHWLSHTSLRIPIRATPKVQVTSHGLQGCSERANDFGC